MFQQLLKTPFPLHLLVLQIMVKHKIIDVLGSESTKDSEKISILSRTVEAISVSDFSLLLTKENIIGKAKYHFKSICIGKKIV